MKHHLALGLSLLGCAAWSAHGEEAITNRLSASARLGFGIKAQFNGIRGLHLPSGSRHTPGGDAYNYDDGYVLTDVSGNAGGQTWYWGYDNSATQVANDHILLSRSSINGAAGATSVESDPAPGAEILDRYQLRAGTHWRFGVEGALNYLNLSLNDTRTLHTSVTRTTSPFAFASGTTPPSASPGQPYQGSYEGPGFLINDTPDAPQTQVIAGGALIMGQRSLDANLWGCRLGPYLELPLNEHWNVSLSGGFAGGLLDTSVSWNETAVINGSRSVTLSGSGNDVALLYGFYAGAEVSYEFGRHWSALAGAQFQYLNDYQHSFGGREVAVNLKSAFFLTLGVGYSF